MVNASDQRGQSVVEYIVMFGFLTLIGLLIMNAFIGPEGDSGAITAMRDTGMKKIAREPD